VNLIQSVLTWFSFSTCSAMQIGWALYFTVTVPSQLLLRLRSVWVSLAFVSAVIPGWSGLINNCRRLFTCSMPSLSADKHCQSSEEKLLKKRKRHVSKFLTSETLVSLFKQSDVGLASLQEVKWQRTPSHHCWCLHNCLSLTAVNNSCSYC